ncbi:WD domain protein, partial [Mortierella sp. AD032]
ASCQVLRKWDAGTGVSSEPIPLEFAEPRAVSCMAFTRDCSQYAVGYRDGSIHLWNRQTEGQVLEGHSSVVRMLVYSPCSRWIASHDYNTVRLWDLHNMDHHRVLVVIDRDLEGRIRVVVFSAIGDQLAVGSEFRTVRLFDIPTMELLACRDLIENYLVSIAYSPKGRQIAIGAEDGCIYLWDLQSEKAGAKLSGHNGWVRCVAYALWTVDRVRL